jgi:electron transfer flavoprotein alpha subunit
MMSLNAAPVWVIAEQIEGVISEVCIELIGQAAKLGADLGVAAEAILLGDISSDQVDMLYQAGAEVVFQIDFPDFDRFQTEIISEAIVILSREYQPQILLIGSTYLGRELAPLIAAKLNTGLTAHCIDLIINEDKILEQWIPAYGGLIVITCPDKRPQIATVARGVFPASALDKNKSGKVIPVGLPEDIHQRVKTLEIIKVKPEGVPLEEAQTVVAGGAGAGSLEGWEEIENLADILNAALGSTRPVVDEGWSDLETMIGQSGKMVHPDLYIGVGLSGEQQHMVGIAGAKIMVAINNDPKSPVFEQVDFGIVENCREFIPLFINKLKEYLNKSNPR